MFNPVEKHIANVCCQLWETCACSSWKVKLAAPESRLAPKHSHLFRDQMISDEQDIKQSSLGRVISRSQKMFRIKTDTYSRFENWVQDGRTPADHAWKMILSFMSMRSAGTTGDHLIFVRGPSFWKGFCFAHMWGMLSVSLTAVCDWIAEWWSRATGRLLPV